MTVNEFTSTRCAGRREEEKDGNLQQVREEVLYERETKKESNPQRIKRGSDLRRNKGKVT